MLKDVIQVRPRGDHRLHILFEDGVEGEVDVAFLIPFEGVFAELRDPAVFRAVAVHPELGTICWPNGADLDPDVLYAMVRGEPVPDLSRAPAARN